jgi:hypothetical protein
VFHIPQSEFLPIDVSLYFTKKFRLIYIATNMRPNKDNNFRNKFSKLVSCARCLSDFCGVCSNLAPILSSFPLVSMLHFLAGFLSRSDPVDLILLISLWMPVMLGTVILGNL